MTRTRRLCKFEQTIQRLEEEEKEKEERRKVRWKKKKNYIKINSSVLSMEFHAAWSPIPAKQYCAHGDHCWL